VQATGAGRLTVMEVSRLIAHDRNERYGDPGRFAPFSLKNIKIVERKPFDSLEQLIVARRKTVH
jgi:hypothetical protein